MGRSPNIYQLQCIRDWSTGGCAGGKLSIEFRVHKRKSNNLTYSHDFQCVIGRNLPSSRFPASSVEPPIYPGHWLKRWNLWADFGSFLVESPFSPQRSPFKNGLITMISMMFTDHYRHENLELLFSRCWQCSEWWEWHQPTAAKSSLRRDIPASAFVMNSSPPRVGEESGHL